MAVTPRDTSATIRWQTSEAATGQVEYGRTEEYGLLTGEAGASYRQSVDVPDLQPGTLHHFRLRAKDGRGNGTVSADATFTTLTQAEMESRVRAARAAGDLPKTYYVRTGGSDSSDGLSPATAWQHPSRAAQAAEAGDTVLLVDDPGDPADGVWAREYVVFAHAGIAEAPIVLAAYSGTPTLDGVDRTGVGIDTNNHSFIEIRGLTLTRYNMAIWTTATSPVYGITVMGNSISQTSDSAIWLRGFANLYALCISDNVMVDCTINGDAPGMVRVIGVDSVYDSTIKNNTIRDANGGAIIGYGFSNNLIEGNRLTNTGRAISGYAAHDNIVAGNTLTTINDRGIRFDYNCVGNLIVGNRCRDVASSGINLYPGTRSVVRSNVFDNTGVYSAGVAEALFENNVWNARSNQWVQLAASDAYPNTNVTFRNNVFVDCHGVWLAGMIDGVVKNNVFVNSPLRYEVRAGGNAVAYNDLWNSAVTGITVEPNNISADPLFADPAAGDFHLRSQAGRWNGAEWVLDGVTSPCIDAGDPSSDYSKEPAPNGGRVDMGAYGNTWESSRSAP